MKYSVLIALLSVSNAITMKSTKFLAQQDGPECACGDGEFCNNDVGANLGACEPCADFGSAADCAASGLPDLGVAECELCVFATPALAQTKGTSANGGQCSSWEECDSACCSNGAGGDCISDNGTCLASDGDGTSMKPIANGEACFNWNECGSICCSTGAGENCKSDAGFCFDHDGNGTAISSPALSQKLSQRRLAQRQRRLAQQEAPEEEGPELGTCACKDAEFCNNDGGANIGLCEPCSNYEVSADCSGDGLPELGAAACQAQCFATPALSQRLSQRKLAQRQRRLAQQDATTDAAPATEEEGPAHGPCACGDGEFCNNDGGSNIGFCEPCADFETELNCNESGLPADGALACEAKCFAATAA